MRSEYTPLSHAIWVEYLSQPDAQAGGNIIGFRGDRYQRGAGIGNILRGLFRIIVPLAKSAGKSIGREALTAGGKIAKDVLDGERIETAVVKHGRHAAGNLAEEGGKAIARKLQKGGTVGRVSYKRKKHIKGVGRKQNITQHRKRKDALGIY